MNEMKVFFADGYKKGRIGKLPVPVPKGNKCVVKIAYCGICGTDQDLFSSDCSFVENGQVTYPVRLGHEWSGIIESVGEKVTDFKVGDRVVGENAVACNKCEDCMKGEYEKCKIMHNVGTIHPVYDGAFCEYYLIPDHNLHKIPDGISLKEASLAEPLSVAYGGIKHMKITEDSFVVVIGTGCIGMAAVVLAKCLGAKEVCMVGRNEKKLLVAEKLGAKTLNIKKCDATEEIRKMTDGKGADFVLECSGAKETFKQAIDMIALRGTISLIGFYEHKENDVNIDLIVSKAVTMYGIMGEMGNIKGALKILEEKKPDLTPIITDELLFDECLVGFTRANYPDSVKTTVTIGGGK